MEPRPAIEGIPGGGATSRLPPTQAANTILRRSRISGSVTTPRHPPMQAAKKCWIGPRLFPVPPAESPVDGAGPQRGRKDGPPDSYLEPLNPHGSPFFFGFQKPFFFQQRSETGFDRFLRDRLTHPHPSWPSAMTPFPWRGKVYKRCAAPYKKSGPMNLNINHTAGLPLIRHLLRKGHLPPGEGLSRAGAVSMSKHPHSGPFPSGKGLCAEFFWQNRNFSFTLRPGYDNLLRHAKCQERPDASFRDTARSHAGVFTRPLRSPRANQMKGGIFHDP